MAEVTLLKELRCAWRVMWKLGGPIHVFVYELNGSLDRRIDDLRNRGPCSTSPADQIRF